MEYCLSRLNFAQRKTLMNLWSYFLAEDPIENYYEMVQFEILSDSLQNVLDIELLFVDKSGILYQYTINPLGELINNDY